jgi:hypothetical protein
MDGIRPVGSEPAEALAWVSRTSCQRRPEGTPATQETPHGVTANVDRTDEQKRQVARDFESVLLTKLFDQVQESIGDSGFEEDGTSQQVHGLFWLHLAQDVADKGGFGLWQEIYAYLGQTANVRNPAELIDEEL